MTEIVIHCIPESGTDPSGTAAELEAYLRDTGGAEPLLVEVEQPQIGLAEVMAIIQLTSAAIDLTQRLIDFLQTRRDKAKDIEIEMDGKRIPIQDLTNDQRKRLNEALA
ncbi:hypothetical protein [Streptantibioticus ferralitis]|uniref:Uncharacterized protein n=1 Tax=Streptantibioticus ferralitis TaxID=236510 RepID=A0ABT5Z9B2_9ACTN|nr:hypothetical protein [Streptantibioticus ferralitis]MDF2260425.1 hypothetical protein [Streptantibioticus ferralitis]